MDINILYICKPTLYMHEKYVFSFWYSLNVLVDCIGDP